MSDFPYTPVERRADLAVHLAGLAFAAVAGPALVAAASGIDGPTTAAAAVYALALAAMIAFSAAYHLVPSRRWRPLLRRLDHAAIYLKIAGTYTPFAALKLGGSGGWLLGAVWSLAGAGAALKMLAPDRFERLSVALYLGLGWAGIVVIGDIHAALSGVGLALLLTGGLLYSGGVAFHLWERLPFHNAIWHMHVLAATMCLYAAIVIEIL